MDLLEPFVVRLFNAGGIKIGEEYPTRNGPKHPIYIDMRVCMENVNLIKLLADLYLSKINHYLADSNYTTFCCVPMGSVYLASILAYRTNSSMMIPRSNGHFCGSPFNSHADNVWIVEDIVTTGTSLKNIKNQIEKEYPRSEEWYIGSICFLQYYNSYNSQNHFNVTNLDKVMAILEKNHLVTTDEAHRVYRFFHPLAEWTHTLKILAENPLKLHNLKLIKKSCVIVALDVPRWDIAKQWIHKLYPYVIGFKFHFDILTDIDLAELFHLSCENNFEILRDRKYGDVSHINRKIQDAINPEIPNVINIFHGFVNLENLTKPAIVVLELSDGDSCPLNNIDYRQQVMKKSTNTNIIGYVSQHKWWSDHKICFTPGVKTMKDVHSKKEQGADIIIVGRMVLESDDPVKACQEISQILSEKR